MTNNIITDYGLISAHLITDQAYIMTFLLGFVSQFDTMTLLCSLHCFAHLYKQSKE